MKLINNAKHLFTNTVNFIKKIPVVKAIEKIGKKTKELVDRIPYGETVISLALCFFVGQYGLHRFAKGKVATGFLYLLTGGIWGLGQITDFCVLIYKAFEKEKER